MATKKPTKKQQETKEWTTPEENRAVRENHQRILRQIANERDALLRFVRNLYSVAPKCMYHEWNFAEREGGPLGACDCSVEALRLRAFFRESGFRP